MSSASPPPRRVPSMGRAALVVGGGILISRILGFLRNVVLLGLLGRTRAADLYNAAFVIPDYLYFLMAGGYLSITFVPILSRQIAAGDSEEEWRTFVAVFRAVGVAMVALTAIAMVFAGPLVRLLYPTFDPASLTELTGLVRVVLPAQVLFVLGSLLMAVQYAHERFLIPTLAPIVYNLAIIAGGTLWWATGDPSPAGFVWGALAGALLGNFALQWWGAGRVGLRWPSSVPWRHPALREYFLLALPLMIGQSVVALEEQFVRVFGQLAGAGGITALVAGRQLAMVPVGVIAQAAGVAAYPFLTRLAAEGRLREMEQQVATAVRFTLTASGLAAAALFAVVLPVVRFAYQRGAFGPEDTLVTAAVLAFYALSVPAWGAQQVYSRGFYAQRRMWPPALLGTGFALLAIPLYLILGRRFGLDGLALTSLLSITGYAAVLAGLWYWSTAGRNLSEVGYAAGRALVGGVLGALAGRLTVAWLVADGVPDVGRSLLALLAGGLVVTVVYAGSLALLRSPELGELLRRPRPSAGRSDPGGGIR